MGTDTQRPLALVIVSGLITRLVISIFLMPALYAIVARPNDRDVHYRETKTAAAVRQPPFGLV